MIFNLIFNCFTAGTSQSQIHGSSRQMPERHDSVLHAGFVSLGCWHRGNQAWTPKRVTFSVTPNVAQPAMCGIVRNHCHSLSWSSRRCMAIWAPSPVRIGSRRTLWSSSHAVGICTIDDKRFLGCWSTRNASSKILLKEQFKACGASGCNAFSCRVLRVLLQSVALCFASCGILCQCVSVLVDLVLIIFIFFSSFKKIPTLSDPVCTR